MKKTTQTLLCAASLGLAFTGALRAADHGDAPTLGPDQGADIADVYAFLDPNDNAQVVLIATTRGFIVPSEAKNFAIFDDDVRYTFHIENTGDSTPDMFIDVNFNQVQRPPIAPVKNLPGFNVQRSEQDALISFRGKVPADLAGAKGKSYARVLPPSLDTAAPARPNPIPDLVNAAGVNLGIKLFAGEADDPFFFDIPAFSRFVGGDANAFSRARDSFAGYNCMAIALRIPATKLRSTKANASTTIGVSFSTSRKTQHAVKGDLIGTGGYIQVDRLGVPGVNVAFIPYNSKNSYNGGTTIDDGKGKFKGLIGATLVSLGTQASFIDTLASVVGQPPVVPIPRRGGVLGTGDYLRLETNSATKPNPINPNDPTKFTGGGGGDANGFPNGRRLRDDVIDTILTLVNNGGTVGDGVNASDVPPLDVFPFVALPQQPRVNGTTEDNTRN